MDDLCDKSDRFGVCLCHYVVLFVQFRPRVWNRSGACGHFFLAAGMDGAQNALEFLCGPGLSGWILKSKSTDSIFHADRVLVDLEPAYIHVSGVEMARPVDRFRFKVGDTFQQICENGGRQEQSVLDYFVARRAEQTVVSSPATFRSDVFDPKCAASASSENPEDAHD